MNNLEIIVLSVIINLLLFLNLKKLIIFFELYDYPDNKRKLHKLPIPLLGGIIIYINLISYFAYNLFIIDKSLQLSLLLSLILPASCFFVLGFFDDKKNLSSYVKFSFMTLILIFTIFINPNLKLDELNFSFTDYKLDLEIFAFPTTILCFLLFINAFNMIDGINGQSGLYSLIVFLVLYNNNTDVLLVILIFALLLFLYLNFSNKIFLGDSGTLLLGYLISYFCIIYYKKEVILFVDEIFILMCIPGYELVRLFAIRIYKKKNPFSADSNHLHHYLIRKLSYLKTFILMQLILVSPYCIYIILNNFYISLFVSLSFYSLLILFLDKDDVNKN